MASPRFYHSRLRVACSTAVLILLVLAYFPPQWIASTADDQEAHASTMLTQLSEFEILEETYDLIRSNYVLSNEVTDEQLMYGAAEGMVESLGDEGHSTFLDPEEAEDFEKSLSNELIGIGVQLDLSGPLPIVIAPLDGSPAYEAGIRPGDVIISVDGQAAAEVDSSEVGDLIRGPEGTNVTLILRHADESEVYEVVITRSPITIEPVSYAMLPNDILWLRVSQFSEGASIDVTRALEWGSDRNMAGVILDLRNNPGGFTKEAQLIASQFLPIGGILYREQLANGTVRAIHNTSVKGAWIEGDLVVLVNGGSASSSEIVSSAIRDNDRGILIGETTFGTGTVLVGFELSDGSVALLGTKLWLTANGHDIWKKGINPTTEVMLEGDEFPALPILLDSQQPTIGQFNQLSDEQLNAAYAALTK